MLRAITIGVLSVVLLAALKPPHTVIGYDTNHDRERGFTVTDQGVVVIAKGERPEVFSPNRR